MNSSNRPKKRFLLLLVAIIFVFSSCTLNFPPQRQTTHSSSSNFRLSEVPEYSNDAFAVINQNTPFFTEDELSKRSFEFYSPLDSLGRCGVCTASIGTDLMPTEKRGEIGQIKPTGWHTARYNGIVDGNYLYKRCHLIGYQLSGENPNEKNLITGTRYMNTEGMLPFENKVSEYVKETNNHVMYRATPIFEGENLLATGVLLEAYSVEDSGEGIKFCVFCYNVQPGIKIDYSNGKSLSEAEENEPNEDFQDEEYEETEYFNSNFVINKNTKKFHKPSCGSIKETKPKNKEQTNKTAEELEKEGYSPCKSCNPE